MMNEKVQKRALLPEDLEVRIANYGANSFTAVVYVTARTAMYLLDEVFGPKNWSRKTVVDRKGADSPFYALCSIEVKDEDGNVFTRDDVGEDDKSPKNAVSDSIKRAATNFIPSLRALYTLPPLRIMAKDLGIELQSKDSDAKKKELKSAVEKMYLDLYVKSISFDTGATGEFVRYLEIANKKTDQILCKFTSKQSSVKKEESEELIALKAAMKAKGVSEENVLNMYGPRFKVTTLEEIANTKNIRDSVYVMLNGMGKNKEKDAPAGSVNEQLKKSSKAATMKAKEA